MEESAEKPLGMRELQSALERLDQYTRKQQPQQNPHFQHPLRRIASLARCFLTALVSDTVKDRDLKKEPEVIEAIEVIQHNYLLLEKMRRGSPDQVQLAETALEIIQRFNKKIQAEEQSPAMNQHFARFFRGLNASFTKQSTVIQAPLPAFWQESNNSKEVDLNAHRLQLHDGNDKITAMARCPLGSHCTPTRREMDAFRMKAVTMIRSVSYPISSVSETLRAVQQGAVHGRRFRDDVVTFRQAIEPFPGETLTLEGSFIRSEHTLSHSTPLPHSFHLSTKSLQSGFPFPEQHNGWALSDRLIPFIPQMLEDRPQLAQLLNRKQALANQLLPKGTRRAHALRYLNLKKRVANHNKGEFLALHEELACALQGDNLLVKRSAAKQLFAWLKTRAEPWDDLCRIYRWIIDWFIHEPSDRIRDLWVDRKLAMEIYTESASDRFAYACSMWQMQIQSTLENLESRLKKYGDWLPGLETTDFITSVGLPITDAALTVTLQFMAPQLEVAPPMLGPYAIRLQQSVYEQLLLFLRSMELDLPKSDEEAEQHVYESLLLSLRNDLRTFTQNSEKNEEATVFTLAKELSLPLDPTSANSGCKISSSAVTQSSCAKYTE